MKLVKFKDGTYGVRRWSWNLLSYEYLYFSNFEPWWSHMFIHSKSWRTTEEKARKEIDYLTDKGKVIE